MVRLLLASPFSIVSQSLIVWLLQRALNFDELVLVPFQLNRYPCDRTDY